MATSGDLDDTVPETQLLRCRGGVEFGAGNGKGVEDVEVEVEFHDPPGEPVEDHRRKDAEHVRLIRFGAARPENVRSLIREHPVARDKGHNCRARVSRPRDIAEGKSGPQTGERAVVLGPLSGELAERGPTVLLTAKPSLLER